MRLPCCHPSVIHLKRDDATVLFPNKLVLLTVSLQGAGNVAGCLSVHSFGASRQTDERPQSRSGGGSPQRTIETQAWKQVAAEDWKSPLLASFLTFIDMAESAANQFLAHKPIALEDGCKAF